MTRRVTDSRIFQILGFSLFLSFGGGSLALGQTQPCAGCLPPSTGTPSYPQPYQPTYNPYNPRIPSYPGSSSTMGPQTSPSGWTMPVPDRVSIGQSGQVYFHYGPPYPGLQERVPVSGIDPYKTFSGGNGLPHWSSLGLSGMNVNYNSSLSFHSSVHTFSTYGAGRSPIEVASVYNSNTGVQVNSNGFPTAVNNFGTTSYTYRNLNSPTYTSSTSFTSSSFNNSYVNNYNPPSYTYQPSRSLSQMQQTINTSGPMDRFNSAGVNSPFGQFRNLADTGRQQFSAGNYKEAMEAYNRALPVSRAADDKVGQAVTHASIAQIYLALGNGQQAVDNFNQSLLLSQKIGSLKIQIDSLRGMGAAYLLVGDTGQALESYHRARAVVRRFEGPVSEAEIIAGMGWVYQSSGEPRQALKHYEEALALIVKSGNRALEARTRVGIGLLYHSLGEANKALDQYRQALEIAKVAQEVTAAEVAGLLISAAETYQSVGMKQKALYCYEHALPLLKDAKNKVAEAGLLAGRARVYASYGLLNTALEYYQRALGLMRDEGNRAGEGGTLAGIGEVYFWEAIQGERMRAWGFPGPTRSEKFPHALKYYDEALSVMKAMDNRVGQVGILTNIALVYDSWDKPEKALEYYHQAITGLESLRTSARLEEFRTSLAQQSTAVYQRAILLHLRRNQGTKAFELSERARARTFLDQLGNAKLDLRRGGDAQLIAREQTLRQPLAALENQLAQELMKPVAQINQEVIQSLEKWLVAGRKEYEDILTQLKLARPEYASLVSVDTLTLPQTQQLLSPEVTLVSYFVTAEKTMAFVITKRSFEVIELSVSQGELGMKVDWFRQFPNLKDVPQKDLKQLHKWLIAPIRSHLKTPLIGIIPHGVLHNLPFAALTDGKEYLGDKHTLFYLPSVSSFRYLQPQQSGGNKMLALVSSEGEGLASLHYARGEAEALAKFTVADVRAGGEATASALHANAGKYNILHFITHYELNKDTPLFSRLFLAPDKNGKRSLEFHEVYGLNLEKVDLVVLSVCDANSGARSRGDDITGLNRAFMSAGAPTVIASLWKVDDQATSVLMAKFYEGYLEKGKSKAEALHYAQVQTRAQYPHPYFWAGFVLTGHPGKTTVTNSSHAVDESDNR